MKSFEPKLQVSAESYQRRMGLTSFINASYQIRDCLRFDPKRVLVIGTGLGLEAAILRNLGIDVVVMDIDADLRPDVVGSVDDLSRFRVREFDVVIAAHVLEHLPYIYFDRCLREIARVGHRALIYLPFACLVPEFRIAVEPIFRKTFRVRIPFFWKRHQFNGEHYWEIGTRGFSLAKVRSDIVGVFSLIEEYHNWDWRYSYNFILHSR